MCTCQVVVCRLCFLGTQTLDTCDLRTKFVTKPDDPCTSILLNMVSFVIRQI
ncbi:hypothetical protein M758_4G245100 [Ceratodon purpureus]|uniref:Uncharacterized protein n=1 Tax=Ceratodon purpureus TaxID=3225 RepID=A0A8T0IEI5_CERPU|nr:hypothetical protein KC19_4G240600 [Ceratodon purpureus]KAG0620798.1 hypothetical protein M758_4G245100 [Ceratodon purpureus]